MTPREFCFWLQGFIELEGPEELSAYQLKVVKGKLDSILNPPIGPECDVEFEHKLKDCTAGFTKTPGFQKLQGCLNSSTQSP